MDWVRPAVRSLEGYVPGEQPRDGGFIKLNTNENPYPPSPKVIEALRHACGEGLRLYPDSLAWELRSAAATRYGFAPEEILAGNGSDDLLAMIVRACLGRGDAVCYPTPTYTLYDTLVSIQEARALTFPFPADFTLPEGLAEAGAKVTFICNPNSPSGTWVPIEEIESLAKRCSGLVVVDEAYVDFAPASALSLAKTYPNVLVLRSFSKSFSLAGMRLGLAFGSREMIEVLAKVKDSYNVSRLALIAGVKALEDYQWMERNVERIRRTREKLLRGLERLGYAVLPSHANFVMARRPGRDLGGLVENLKERRLLVRHFPLEGLRDAVRITVGTDQETDTLLEALADFG